MNVPFAVVVKAAEFYKQDLSYFYSMRGPVSNTMNDQASNSHVEQQHSMPKEVMDRLMERYEAMNERLMSLLEKFMPGK
ncbi:MAG: hypothetical protein JSU02_00770 [Bacteroidetes bacterium]|nr:hypothetical protein [Bacteroidota bacterium]